MPTTLRSKKKPAKPSTEPKSQDFVGSGNVFHDLGLPNPDLLLAKATLVQQIRDLIDERKLTQAKAASLLGFGQPKISALLRGRTDGYSLDQLFKCLNALGQDVDIIVRPTSKGAAASETRVK